MQETYLQNLERLIINVAIKPYIFDKNVHKSIHFCYFHLNSDRVLESLTSVGNVDHKKQSLYSLFSSPYVVVLPLAVANDF